MHRNPFLDCFTEVAKVLFEANSTHIELMSPSSTEISEVGTLSSKEACYAGAEYPEALKALGIAIDPTFEMNEASREMLMTIAQTVPRDSLFSDRLFDRTCQALAGKNERRLVQHTSSLIVAPAGQLRVRGGSDLEHLVDAYHEKWNRMTPFTEHPPQPTYSVGFGLSAFSQST